MKLINILYDIGILLLPISFIFDDPVNLIVRIAALLLFIVSSFFVLKNENSKEVFKKEILSGCSLYDSIVWLVGTLIWLLAHQNIGVLIYGIISISMIICVIFSTHKKKS